MKLTDDEMFCHICNQLKHRFNSSPQELMREVKETGWDGGGQNPANLSRAEVQVATKH